MATWKIACVQMDVRLGDKAHNLVQIRDKLSEAADGGAHLVIFPESAVTAYGFNSKEEAWEIAEIVPGPSTEKIMEDCFQLGVHAVVGSLERVEETGELFNVALLMGPDGIYPTYRKIHLPYLGVDRFVTPGNIPFAVNDLGGLRVGMNICYDGGFPEATRCLMLQGADLVVLPTNWPEGARVVVKHLVQARALENQIYFAAANRVGEEAGFRFIGLSRIVNVNGELLAALESDSEETIFAEIDPGKARNKHIAFVPGSYELHRTAHRRPEMYGKLVEPLKEKFVPKG